MKERVRVLNRAPARPGARYVLYWAQMNRRVNSNHALEWAVQQANQWWLPVLFYEGLTCSYPEANDRLHTFILQGVEENERRCRERGLGYCFYLRRRRADANDVLYRLAADAALVVTDDYPVFIAARHNARVPGKLPVAVHAVDSSCVIPMNRFDKREYAAYSIRPKIRRLLGEYLKPLEETRPLRRWTEPAPEWHARVTAAGIAALAASCEINHSVPPSTAFSGGRLAAEKRLEHFLENNLRRYARERNQPAAHATSNLSPYLHFGCLLASEAALAARAHAARHGLIETEFLEELIVRRELAFNHARHTEQPGCLENLPAWARETLRRHAGDRRNPVYGFEQFERAGTHDDLWNACQKELLLRGKIHGYYRMYWGKKIIEWSPSCEEAASTMIQLHDRYALDGRDPATYANILWCFGPHDRPWKERAVFGMVRYMSLEGMKRKTGVDAYLREIAELERTGTDPLRLEQ